MEKIQRLADQCWLQKFHLNEDGAHDYYEFDYEKFAQLIIFECAEVARNDLNLGAMEISEAIIENFGI